VVLFFFALLVPTLVEQFYRIYLNSPGIEEIRSYLHQLDQYIATLPAPTQETVNNVYNQAVERVRANVGIYVTGLVNLMVTAVFSTVNTISFLLGFLIVPGWLLMILQGQRRGVQTLNRLLPAWLAPDFWGVMRIFNRTLNAFVRGQLVLALAVTVLTYLGLAALAWQFGLQGENLLRYELFLAMIAGLMQLIPTIGPFLGAIPAVLVGFLNSTELGVGIILVYILVQLIILYFAAPYVERSIIDIHPAILLIVIVALSVFGFWWVLLAAPVTAIVRDLFLYVYGRFSDPPRPAGLLPGEPLPLSQSQAAAQTQRIPLAYRHSRAVR
jgi:predicted PurR-regulated permease PerM